MKINFIAPHLVLWSDVGAAVYPAVVLRHIGADPLELAAEITLMRNYLIPRHSLIHSFLVLVMRTRLVSRCQYCVKTKLICELMIKFSSPIKMSSVARRLLRCMRHG